MFKYLKKSLNLLTYEKLLYDKIEIESLILNERGQELPIKI